MSASEPVRGETLPVLAEVRELPTAPAGWAGALAAVPGAAVAASGFLAGAAAAAVIGRRRARRRSRAGQAITVRGARSFLVDVHLIDRG